MSNTFKQDWFTEIASPRATGFATSIKQKTVLHKEKSQYQNIMVFDSQDFGKCLVLDDVVQCTERDEFSYQEMMAFLPLESHPKPSRVLIIGGGDGGVARECLKHPMVKSVVQCEIDARVVEVAKKYLPSMAVAYSDPRLKLVIADGCEFARKLAREDATVDNRYDVIITDSSDPEGPAESLFNSSYYEHLSKVLAPEGIICSQAESIWFELELVSELVNMGRKLFSQVGYATCMSCTYPGGQIGFLMCTNSKVVNLKRPIGHKLDLNKLNLRYYGSKVHEASFVLPRFASQKLGLEEADE